MLLNTQLASLSSPKRSATNTTRALLPASSPSPPWRLPAATRAVWHSLQRRSLRTWRARHCHLHFSPASPCPHDSATTCAPMWLLLTFIYRYLFSKYLHLSSTHQSSHNTASYPCCHNWSMVAKGPSLQNFLSHNFPNNSLAKIRHIFLQSQNMRWGVTCVNTNLSASRESDSPNAQVKTPQSEPLF
jgi:hypothetical protein